MNKVIYALIVAAIIVVVVAGSYFLLNSRKGEGGGGKADMVANAASLQYNAEVKAGWTRQVYTVSAKNVNSSNMMLRVDVSANTGANLTWILNNGTKTAWIASNYGWTDVSSDFADQWNTFVGENKRWTTDIGHLANDWNGTGNCNYVSSTTGETVTIYNVIINPTLADSLFQHNS